MASKVTLDVANQDRQKSMKKHLVRFYGTSQVVVHVFLLHQMIHLPARGDVERGNGF